MLEYHAAYYRLKEDDGWYAVRVLDFPGINTQGRTLREARFMVKDAIQVMVECYLDEGRRLPKPTPTRPTPGPSGLRRFDLKSSSIGPCRHETDAVDQTLA